MMIPGYELRDTRCTSQCLTVSCCKREWMVWHSSRDECCVVDRVWTTILYSAVLYSTVVLFREGTEFNLEIKKSKRQKHIQYVHRDVLCCTVPWYQPASQQEAEWRRGIRENVAIRSPFCTSERRPLAAPTPHTNVFEKGFEFKFWRKIFTCFELFILFIVS